MRASLAAADKKQNAALWWRARARARTEGRIIDTDSPNGASTCCVYVRSDNSISQRGPPTRKLAGKKKARRMRAAGIRDLARRDYEHV